MNTAISKEINIKKGALFKVINLREISSAILDEGDNISVLLSEPTYVDKSILFPKNSIFHGYVEKINEPVEGINASIKVKMTQIVTPDDKRYYIHGYLTQGSGDTIGGAATPTKYYMGIPHYIEGIGGGVLRYAPTGSNYMGENLIIKAGAELFVIFSADFIFAP